MYSPGHLLTFESFCVDCARCALKRKPDADRLKWWVCVCVCVGARVRGCGCSGLGGGISAHFILPEYR